MAGQFLKKGMDISRMFNLWKAKFQIFGRVKLFQHYEPLYAVLVKLECCA